MWMRIDCNGKSKLVNSLQRTYYMYIWKQFIRLIYENLTRLCVLTYLNILNLYLFIYYNKHGYCLWDNYFPSKRNNYIWLLPVVNLLCLLYIIGSSATKLYPLTVRINRWRWHEICDAHGGMMPRAAWCPGRYDAQDGRYDAHGGMTPRAAWRPPTYSMCGLWIVPMSSLYSIHTTHNL